METFSKYFLYFLTYSFIGWAWEVFLSFVRTHKFVNRGFLNGPYCPIYGIGALLFLQLQYFTDRKVELFFLGAVIACALEYIISFTLEKLFKARWWDYSDWPMNLNGRICIYGFIVFGIASVIMPSVHANVAALYDSWSENFRNVLSIVLAVLFVADIASTNASLAKFNKVLRKYQEKLKFPAFIQKKIDQGKQIFTFQQRRILKAFPDFISIRYEEAFKHIRQLNEKGEKKFKESKFKPIRK